MRHEFYNELLERDGQVRNFAQEMMDVIEKYSKKELSARQALAEKRLREVGATFLTSTEDRDEESMLPFDIIPRVFPRREWERLEQALIQRVSALNLFLMDIYGDQKILNDGIIPKELVYSSSGYLEVCQGLLPQWDIWNHISGIDLIRHSDGNFYVLEDNLRCPSGVSYMIKNRCVQKQILPECFENHRVLPVDQYADDLYQMLQYCAPEYALNPKIVLLTPGIYNAAYFEHRYLAQSMGIDLVQGEDLLHIDDEIFLQTAMGLERVDVIYRRIDDDFLDPRVFRKDSLLGVPGLMAAYRKNRVTIVNAPGSGVADDKAVYRYVPDMIRYYLQQTPLLDNVPTYCCFIEKECAHVLENLEQMVVKSVHLSGGKGMLIGPQSTLAQRESFALQIKAHPREYIAQPVMDLSVSPTWIDGEWVNRHVDIRPFILQGKSIVVSKGGLTRVARTEGSLVVNSSQGGGGKDTWVLADNR